MLAGVDQFNNKNLALFDLDRDFFAGHKTIEESWGWQHARMTELVNEFDQIFVDLWIHEIGVEVVVATLTTACDGFDFFARGVEVDLLGAGTGAAFVGFTIAEHDLLDGLWPAALGLAEATGKHIDDGLGESCAGVEINHILGLDALGQKEDGEVADYLGRRGDLDDIAEHGVDLVIVANDFRPAGTEA